MAADISNVCMYLGRYLGVPCPPTVLDRLLYSVRGLLQRMSGDQMAYILFYLASSGAQLKERCV